MLAGAFLALVLPLGVVLATVTPPGQVADEVGHIERATALSEGHVLGRRVSLTGSDGVTLQDAGVDGDPAPALAAFQPPPAVPKLGVDDIAKARQRRWLGKDYFLQITPLAVYLPLLYVPSAAGLGVARLLGASPFHAILAGRLAALLAYGAVGLAALIVARRGRALLFCTLAVPMAVSLGASFNQDGLFIAVSALAAALASRGPEDRAARLAAAVLICVMATVKLPYLVLAAMLLLPFGEGGWPVLRARIGLVVLIALPAVAWTTYAMWAIAAPVHWPAYQAGPLWPGAPSTMFASTNAAAQLRVLAADPLRILTLPLRTIWGNPWLARQAIGVLGWLAIPLPPSLYAAWAVAVGCALGADGFGCRAGRSRLQWANSGMLVLAVLTGVVLIYMSQVLGLDFGRSRAGRGTAGTLPAPARAHAGDRRAQGRSGRAAAPHGAVRARSRGGGPRSCGLAHDHRYRVLPAVSTPARAASGREHLHPPPVHAERDAARLQRLRIRAEHLAPPAVQRGDIRRVLGGQPVQIV